MHPREPRRWQTKFGLFISDVGVSRLRAALTARGVGVTPQAVYGWISGSHGPSRAKVRALVAIARGRIGAEDIIRHRDEVQRSA